LPYYRMLGNHDRRDTFTRVFTQFTPDSADFMQYAADTPAGVFVFIDTLENDTHDAWQTGRGPLEPTLVALCPCSHLA
jgi:3',5'-cyclic-AMP phosphodiesterase